MRSFNTLDLFTANALLASLLWWNYRCLDRETNIFNLIHSRLPRFLSTTLTLLLAFLVIVFFWKLFLQHFHFTLDFALLDHLVKTLTAPTAVVKDLARTYSVMPLRPHLPWAILEVRTTTEFWDIDDKEILVILGAQMFSLRLKRFTQLANLEMMKALTHVCNPSLSQILALNNWLGV